MGGVKYRVIFRGEVVKGFSAPDVVKNLAAIFKKDSRKISKMFSGEKISVKKNADLETCEKTKKILERAGAICHIEPHVKSPTEALTESDLIDDPYADPHEEDEEDVDEHVEPEDESEEAEEDEGKDDAAPQQDVTVTRGKKEAAPPPLPEEDERPAEETTAVSAVSAAPREEGINKAALLLATMPLGAWGVHKFYLGKYVQGVLYLIFSWTGIPGIVALIEFIIYATTSAENLNKKYKTPGPTALVLIIANFGPFVLMAIAGIIAAISIPAMLAMQDKFSAPAVTVKPQAPVTRSLPAHDPDMSEAVPLPVSAGPNGTIHGRPFTIEKAVMDIGILSMRQGGDFFADLEVMVFLFLDDESPANKTFTIKPDSTTDFTQTTPHVYIKWKEAGVDVPKVETYVTGYTMNLELGDIKDDHITGKIDVTLPDEMKSHIFGTFTAEIK